MLHLAVAVAGVESRGYSPQQQTPAGEPIQLSPEQQGAVQTLIKGSPVGILVGGPGTGKTTILRTILDAWGTLGISPSRIKLCAPTGKAARRMQEATGREASTIHSLLARGTDDGSANEPAQIEAAVVAVDESSMLDIELASRLLRAIPSGTRLLLIGNTNQLPSVGPGRVLADLLESGVRACRLTEPFRQVRQSQIIQAAYQINDGRTPTLTEVQDAGLDPAQGDCVRIAALTAGQVAEQVVSLVTSLVPQGYGIPAREVRVLVPQYKGVAGINALNLALQAAINPPDPAKIQLEWAPPVRLADNRTVKRILREGDRLLWLSNDPHFGLVNGSEVEVLTIDVPPEGPRRVTLIVPDELDSLGQPKIVTMRLGEVDAVHAYAMSVHKSQGSEYPCAIVVICDEHPMASRPLLYTAVTRAKQYCVVVGSIPALVKAVARASEGARRTQLVERIRALREAAA